jgi:hypothetical protein
MGRAELERSASGPPPGSEPGSILSKPVNTGVPVSVGDEDLAIRGFNGIRRVIERQAETRPVALA